MEADAQNNRMIPETQIDIPRWSVQEDWTTALPGDSFWISRHAGYRAPAWPHVAGCSCIDCEFNLNVQGRIEVTAEGTFVGKDGVRCVDAQPDKGILIVQRDLPLDETENGGETWWDDKVTIKNAVKTMIANKSVLCVDASPSGELVAAGDANGDKSEITIWEAEKGVCRRRLTGHCGDINSMRFFPSGQVILTGSMDMQLRIWSVPDGTCSSTLVGHTRAVTDSVVVGNGKDVCSSSLDGTVRLWNAESGKIVNTFEVDSAGVNAILLVQGSEQFLVAACNNGSLKSIDLRSGDIRSFANTYGHSGSLRCVSADVWSIVTGSVTGVVMNFDFRMNEAIHVPPSHRGDAAITAVGSLHRDKHNLFIASADGSVCATHMPADFCTSLEQEFLVEKREPVNCMSLSMEAMYVGTRGGVIGKYLP